LQGLAFSSDAYERVFLRLRELVEEDPSVVPIERLSDFDREEQALISAVAMTRYPELETGSDSALRLSLAQCLQTLKINARKRRLRAIEVALRDAASPDERNRLSAEHQQLSEEAEAMKEVRSGAG
jgi:hypothetical protein